MYGISYTGDQVDMQRALLQHLRGSALVSENRNELTVETEEYIAESKGVFGLGPRWQEKIVHVVRVHGPREDIRQLADGSISKVLVGEAKIVEVKSRVFERQNENFDWRVKESGPIRRGAIQDFLRDIQGFVSTLSP